jgi:hypothetical protein
VNNFLPPDQDAEHNNNLIVSHNYLITNNLVNEIHFGISLWQFQVKFPIQGTSAISTLDLAGLDPSDPPTASIFPIAAAYSAQIASATATSRMSQPETCSISLRSIRFLLVRWEIVVWESWRDLAPLRSRLGCPRLSISRNGCGCALKARLQIYSIIRTLRHRQRT